MIWACGAAIYLGTLGCATFLVVDGHPWFGLLAFIISGLVTIGSGDES